MIYKWQSFSTKTSVFIITVLYLIVNSPHNFLFNLFLPLVNSSEPNQITKILFPLSYKMLNVQNICRFTCFKNIFILQTLFLNVF